MGLSPAKLSRIAGAILDWFPDHARDMPWRRTLDPYGVWISEIMLQQTQVKTVIPYWNRWMRRLPDAAKLARAREATVLKLWEGLGYYSRARNAQKAAQMIVTEHGGRFPRSRELIESLPGIGRYTAGAIASIAYDEPAPILDGNVIRVLTRLGMIPGDPKGKEVNATLWELAGQLVEGVADGRGVRPAPPLKFAGACSALNQGLMELGATVCLPAKPACLLCPLREHCAAAQAGRAEDFPSKAKKPVITPRHFCTYVLRVGDVYLVSQRGEDEVNAGFWEFPNRETDSAEADPREVIEHLLPGLTVELRPLRVIRHSITRYRMTQRVFFGELKRRPRNTGMRWCRLDEIRGLPFVSAQRRLFKDLEAAGS